MTSANRIIPKLQKLETPASEFARTTCFKGGFLVSKNSGWRSERPVIDHDSCTLCLQCYMLCPDGTIYKQRKGDTLRSVDIDLDFCKGCGICAKECPSSCIEMISEDAFVDAEGSCGGEGLGTSSNTGVGTESGTSANSPTANAGLETGAPK